LFVSKHLESPVWRQEGLGALAFVGTGVDLP
jgi:hypothetical protein